SSQSSQSSQPSQSSGSSKSSQSSGSSAEPRSRYIAFYGAGAVDEVENECFEKTVQPKGCMLYTWDHYLKALHDLLIWLDLNGDRKISGDDVANTTIKLAGFSTGCASAAWVSKMIDQQGTVVDWYTDPETVYTTQTEGVPIATVFNFDPVWYLFPWHGKVGKTVSKYYEYRQTKGDYGSFTPFNPADPPANNVVTAPFTGVEFGSNAAANIRVNITTSAPPLTWQDSIAELGGAYTPQMQYTQNPSQCNHMTVPWIARGEFAAKF
ncbi:MAG: hypothetical protein K9G33_15455, partial [Sneathiella sp.]|nr:hypothetical protein [Sneathiella sp.]